MRTKNFPTKQAAAAYLAGVLESLCSRTGLPMPEDACDALLVLGSDEFDDTEFDDAADLLNVMQKAEAGVEGGA